MKILIIGNGFDLNLGLKTSYKDFIESIEFRDLVKANNSMALYFNEKNEINNWIDIERELTNFSNSIENDQSNIKEEFNDLKTALMNYLKKAQNNEINQSSKAFEMFKNEIHTIDSILNFNYTDSIFKIADILNIDDIEDKHKYVHGSIKNKNIIFGVEDSAKVKNYKFLKKSYDKNHGKYNIKKMITYDFENNPVSDIICFGHSMGITDSSYFSDYIGIRSSIGSGNFTFYYYGETGWDEMYKIFDYYTGYNMTTFRSNNFIPIDSSK